MNSQRGKHPNPHTPDMVGVRHGRLVGIKRLENDKRGSAIWLWQCDCGQQASIAGGAVRKGNTKSCGCLNKEMIQQVGYKNRTHGMYGTRSYRSWSHMLGRCKNPTDSSFDNYGARGIKVCKRWEKFENFINDMGECPPRLTIERINNEKGYYKDNCRWAPKKDQNRNTRANRIFTLGIEIMCLAELAERAGIRHETLQDRLDKGWMIERATSQPIRRIFTAKSGDPLLLDVPSDARLIKPLHRT